MFCIGPEPETPDICLGVKRVVRRSQADIALIELDESARGRAPGVEPIMQLEGGRPRLLIKAHLWIQWGQIAIEREAEAEIARALAGDSLGWETRASLQAISAAAISLDDLGHEVRPLLSDPPPEADSRAGTLHEILNRGFHFGSRIGSGELNQQLRDLFGSRRTALHYQDDASEPVPHPTGTSTGSVDAQYSLERANEAIETLLLVLRTCVEKSRDDTREWAADMRGSVENLVALRGSGPSPGLVAWYHDEH